MEKIVVSKRYGHQVEVNVVDGDWNIQISLEDFKVVLKKILKEKGLLYRNKTKDQLVDLAFEQIIKDIKYQSVYLVKESVNGQA